MRHVDPLPCPDCGHLVYRPLIAPVREPQQSCRAIVAGSDRCGCSHATHRTPAMRPRHRLEAVGA